MKYLKKFNLHAEYLTYINSNNKILPNVSFCEDFEDIHYNPWYDPRLIAKFNVQDDSEATMIYGGIGYDSISVLDYYTKIEVDGVEISLTDLDENYGNYQLSEGEHTIKYTLSEPSEISYAAFAYCSCLTSVTIPDSVTTIDWFAFFSCTGLMNVTIGKGLTSIGDNVFENCTGLTNIEVDNDNSVYDSRNNCNAIIETATNTLIIGCQNTTIPNTVTAIGDKAFNYCSGLTSITIPDSVTSIGFNAFSDCTGLTSITIGNSVTVIYDLAFNGCTGLTNITIPNSVISIASEAFQNCNFLTSVTIGSGVTSIGDGVFNGCTGLTNIVVDNNNSVYDSRNNCNAIIETATNTLIIGCQNTIIPNTVTTIGTRAFNYCSGLTSITIPDSVTTISQYAFTVCSGLTNITSLATTAPTIQNTTFFNIKTGGTLTVPSGSTGYDLWMSTGNYYLGKYNWTKVEQ